MCRERYADEDVRLDLALAFCRKCSTVRDLPANALALAGPDSIDVEPLPPAVRAKEALPSGFRVEERPGSLRISWKVPAGPALGGLVFWLGLGVAGIVQGDFARANSVFLALLGLVALGLGYVAFATLANFSSAEATGEHLRITHGPWPVPWRFGRTLRVAEIDQLACCSTTWRSGTYYDLCALARDGSSTTLVSGLPAPQQALYLEQQFERRLRITDRPVPGELKRP